MLGKMMDQPLLISNLIAHAGRYHGATEVVSVETTGGIERADWSRLERNARRLASALERLGLGAEARCATIAWNNRRHMEIYFGVSGGGFVCHTINPRLHPEQLIYIVNHAEDRVLFFDRTFLPAVAKLREHLGAVDHFVLMGPRDDEAAAMIDGLVFYDELIEQGDPGYAWPQFEETRPSS
ncbi:MAG: AMP-binding protein, partial [Sedimentitalea sp.]|nr:AMP-binding protein [Sedimentitalea sp.]